MCNFFSFCTIPNYNKDGSSRYLYLNWNQRKKLLTSNPNHIEPDSHASICAYWWVKDDKLRCFHKDERLLEDSVNKYEYNPLTKKFKIDQINNSVNDHEKAKEWVKNLDFKLICKPLIIKPLVKPFSLQPKLKKDGTIFKRDFDALKKWHSFRSSTMNSFGEPSLSSANNSAWDSINNSVGCSIASSVWISFWDSVGFSVSRSVLNSVGDSVRHSVKAYSTSFFDIKYEHDFSSIVELWDRGLVPSFDRDTCRLHAGNYAKVVFEIKTYNLF